MKHFFISMLMLTFTFTNAHGSLIGRYILEDEYKSLSCNGRIEFLSNYDRDLTIHFSPTFDTRRCPFIYIKDPTNGKILKYGPVTSNYEVSHVFQNTLSGSCTMEIQFGKHHYDVADKKTINLDRWWKCGNK